MNFNLSDDSHNNEYKLFRDTTEELINLYGIKITYIKTEKINQDEIFGEHTHIKSLSNLEGVYELYALPLSSDNWEGDSFLYSQYGLQNLDTMSLFISASDMEKLHPNIIERKGSIEVNNIPNGNLVLFNSSKVMEITGFELTTAEHANNNVFTSNREKNVYKLTLKSYIYNSDSIESLDKIKDSKSNEYKSFGNLEAIFGVGSDEEKKKIEISEKATEVNRPHQDLFHDKSKIPIVDKEAQKNPFGDLG